MTIELAGTTLLEVSASCSRKAQIVRAGRWRILLILRKNNSTSPHPPSTAVTMSGVSENKYIFTSMGFLPVGANFMFHRWRRGAPPNSQPSASSGQQQRQSSAAGQKNVWGQNRARGTGSGPQSPRTGPTSKEAAVAAPQVNDAVPTSESIAVQIKAYFNQSKCKLPKKRSAKNGTDN